MTEVGLETQKRELGMFDRFVNSFFKALDSKLNARTPRRMKAKTWKTAHTENA